MGFIPKLLAATALLGNLVAAAPSKEDGLKFLEENKKKEGVITLPSGLQYKVLKKGDGKFHPKVDSPCECHYEGTLIDGEKFDSSYDRGSPTTFAPNQVIKGWTEAMQLMVEGDKWEMYIPSELAYGESGSPPKIPGGSTLIFRMEIMQGGIQGGKVPAVKCDAHSGEDCSEQEKKYIEKQNKRIEKDGKEWAVKENARLAKMAADNAVSKNLSRKKREWLDARLKIMTQLAKGKEDL